VSFFFFVFFFTVLDFRAKSPLTTTEFRYNSMTHPVPFMKAVAGTATAKKAAKKEVPDLEEAIEEEDEGEPGPEPAKEDSLDFKNDKYIIKPKAKAAAAKKGVKKANNDEGDGDAGSTKPAAARGKGRPVKVR